MKLIQKIYTLPLLVMAVLMTGCERDYDAPPLIEPIYTGPQPNMTLAYLKEKCSAATSQAPVVITDDYIVKAYITGNDESGNIYKQIIIQDATAALPIQLDQGNVYTTYRRGQEVYINLKDMCVSVYGGEQQLGWPDGYLYRMPFTNFKEHVQKNGWPYLDNVKPEVITDFKTMDSDVARMTYRLVQLEGVYFVNGGKATYATESGYGEQTLKDVHGNTITVRTSNYASFAYETLPVGTGTVIGVLGRFNGGWQLTIPVSSDVFGFDGIIPEEGGSSGGETGDTVLFSETFGEPQKDGTNWPFLKDYTGYNNSKDLFSGSMDKLSARTQSGDGNVWFPTGGDYSLSIGSIDLKGATKVSLVYKMGVNVYQPADVQNINTLSVKCNDTSLAVPSKELVGTSNPYVLEEIRIDDIAVSGTATLTFSCASATNVKGIRLYDVKLIVPGTGEGGGGDVIAPVPDGE
ncbi:DUF5689 domain-containing protein [uncultured Bacteroides sp.]|uniref:DUF5689 domain-containing protein n=1 Tax=uncultured Bacteroides sp. TaxID=162156 RepID=UPI0025F15C35|nr:DUF5689 domain-containing protein [uncultured Bacteroides sp.]